MEFLLPGEVPCCPGVARVAPELAPGDDHRPDVGAEGAVCSEGGAWRCGQRPTSARSGRRSLIGLGGAGGGEHLGKLGHLGGFGKVVAERFDQPGLRSRLVVQRRPGHVASLGDDLDAELGPWLVRG